MEKRDYTKLVDYEKDLYWDQNEALMVMAD
jgi:hypothetical protein